MGQTVPICFLVLRFMYYWYTIGYHQNYELPRHKFLAQFEERKKKAEEKRNSSRRKLILRRSSRKFDDFESFHAALQNKS